jgi:uncharacterized repeat protein (TIGR01451 family)
VLAPGEHNPNIDAGFWIPASLGDYVWLDVDYDGQQDAGEPPVAGATVTLVGPGGSVVSATTSITGYYLFTGLTPGVPYEIVFGLPSGYTWTVTSGTPGDGTNSDAGADGRTAPVTLQPGEHNPNIDAGIWTPPQADVVKSTLNPGAVSTGQEIRYQIAVFNVGQTLLQGVVLTDAVPAGTVYVAGSAQPQAVFASNTLSWTLGDMPPGAAVTVTFAVRVTSTDGNVAIRNTAYMQGSTRFIAGIRSNEVSNPLAPTKIMLERFAATRTGSGVLVEWRTSSENNTLGFNLYRSQTGRRDDARKVTEEMISARGAGDGTSYRYEDREAGQDGVAYYWLEEIELSGGRNEYGPALLASPTSFDVVDWQGVTLAPQADAPAIGGDLLQRGAPAGQDAQRVVAGRTQAAAVAPVVVGVPAAGEAVVAAPVIVQAPVHEQEQVVAPQQAAEPAASAVQVAEPPQTSAPAIAVAPAATTAEQSAVVGSVPAGRPAVTTPVRVALLLLLAALAIGVGLGLGLLIVTHRRRAR